MGGDDFTADRPYTCVEDDHLVDQHVSNERGGESAAQQCRRTCAPCAVVAQVCRNAGKEATKRRDAGGHSEEISLTDEGAKMMYSSGSEASNGQRNGCAASEELERRSAETRGRK